MSQQRYIRQEIIEAFKNIESVASLDDRALSEWVLFNAGRLLGWSRYLGCHVQVCTIPDHDFAEVK